MLSLSLACFLPHSNRLNWQFLKTLTLLTLESLPWPALPCLLQWLCILHFPLPVPRLVTIMWYFNCSFTSLSPTLDLEIDHKKFLSGRIQTQTVCLQSPCNDVVKGLLLWVPAMHSHGFRDKLTNLRKNKRLLKSHCRLVLQQLKFCVCSFFYCVQFSRKQCYSDVLES